MARQLVGDVEPGDAFHVEGMAIGRQLLRIVECTDMQGADAFLAEGRFPAERAAAVGAEGAADAGGGVEELARAAAEAHLFRGEDRERGGGGAGMLTTALAMAMQDTVGPAVDLVANGAAHAAPCQFVRSVRHGNLRPVRWIVRPFPAPS